MTIDKQKIQDIINKKKNKPPQKPEEPIKAESKEPGEETVKQVENEPVKSVKQGLNISEDNLQRRNYMISESLAEYLEDFAFAAKKKIKRKVSASEIVRKALINFAQMSESKKLRLLS